MWKKCLTEDEVKENFDHLLVGNEKNLETYWTFDEGLNTQFFDYSREGTVYNQHHGVIDGNVEPDTETPTYLALKAKTDLDGNFTIQGVPFTGEGTNYNVVPLKNSHEFSPQKQSRFVSASSLDKDIKSAGNGGNKDAAASVGKLVAERALAKDIKEVVFDRGGYVYHGRVAALAEAAREAGLSF